MVYWVHFCDDERYLLIACVAWVGWNDMLLEIFAYPTVTLLYFTDQNWIPKTIYFIRCVMVCKIFSCSEFPKRIEKIGKYKYFALLRASMVFTYYTKLFRREDDRHNGVLMPLLLLVAETIIIKCTLTPWTLCITFLSFRF